jgi:ribose/xylose/arabinose/galactoside ABC-type transport system permease subunit
VLVVVLVTVGWVIVAGLFNFSLAQAFDYPPAAFTFDALVSSLGAASVLAMSLRRLQPGLQHRRRDPRAGDHRAAVDLPVGAIVAVLYMLMTVVILRMIPWGQVATRAPSPRSSSSGRSPIRPPAAPPGS